MGSLHVLSAGSTLHGLKAVAPLAMQTIGSSIEIDTDHGHDIRDAALRGRIDADVVLLPADMIATLAAQNLARDPVALGSVGIGGVVRAGARPPAIDTMAALRNALIAADAVMLTRAPTGDHLIHVIDEIGLHHVVGAKLMRFETATRLNAAIADRLDDTLGFAPETEIRASAGVTYVGGVPHDIQVALPYAAARLTQSARRDLVAAFLDFLGTPRAHDAFVASGVRPSA
jgi:molybdate transport system substrate-binding protein